MNSVRVRERPRPLTGFICGRNGQKNKILIHTRNKRYRFQRGKKFKHNLGIHTTTDSPCKITSTKIRGKFTRGHAPAYITTFKLPMMLDIRKIIPTRTHTNTHGDFQSSVMRGHSKDSTQFWFQNIFRQKISFGK